MFSTLNCEEFYRQENQPKQFASEVAICPGLQRAATRETTIAAEHRCANTLNQILAIIKIASCNSELRKPHMLMRAGPSLTLKQPCCDRGKIAKQSSHCAGRTICSPKHHRLPCLVNALANKLRKVGAYRERPLIPIRQIEATLQICH